MNKTVLITGGSGLVGQHLIPHLIKQGHIVKVLTRSKSYSKNGIDYFNWDPAKNKIDSNALQNVTDIIHLAGASIIKKWTPTYKQTIIDSRTQGVVTLKKELLKTGQKIDSFISASGIGIYASSKSEQNEKSPIGPGFVANVCRYWELEADGMQTVSNRVVKCRIGYVLTPKDGGLAPLKILSKLGIGSAVGNGEQFMSWIHIHDIVGIFAFALNQKNLTGAYNLVAPNPVSNKDFMYTLAKVLNRPILAPKVPAFIIKVILGQRAQLLLGSANISSQKIINAGYTFQFTNLTNALKAVTHP